MSKAVLSLGSNQGASLFFLEEALYLLEVTAGVWVNKVSPVYWSQAWRPPNARDFPFSFRRVGEEIYFNQCALLVTSLPPLRVLERCLEIERSLGRIGRTSQARLARWQPRTIDIDLILYNTLALSTPRLTLPHPRAADRLFVLKPLVDICPGALIGGRTAVQLLRRTRDKTRVYRCRAAPPDTELVEVPCGFDRFSRRAPL